MPTSLVRKTTRLGKGGRGNCEPCKYEGDAIQLKNSNNMSNICLAKVSCKWLNHKIWILVPWQINISIVLLNKKILSSFSLGIFYELTPEAHQEVATLAVGRNSCVYLVPPFWKGWRLYKQDQETWLCRTHLEDKGRQVTVKTVIRPSH